MRQRLEKAEQISNLVIDLDIIDRKLHVIRSEVTTNPLTKKQLEVMGLLVRNPDGLTIKEIANILKVSSSAVVQVIDSFDQRKYIAKRTHKSDKRASVAYISERGEQYIKDNLEEFTREYDQRLFRALTPEEFGQLCEYVHRIVVFTEPVSK